MGWGTQGSGQTVGLRARVEAVNEIVTEKGERTEIEHTDAVLMIQGETKDEIIERELPNGRKIVYFNESGAFRNARDAYFRLMGVGQGEKPNKDFIVGTTFEYRVVTRKGSDFIDFIPNKIVETAPGEAAPAVEALSLDQVAALLDGKTPREAMALRGEPGIKGTSHEKVVTLKSQVPAVYPVDYDDATGTYKRRS